MLNVVLICLSAPLSCRNTFPQRPTVPVSYFRRTERTPTFEGLFQSQECSMSLCLRPHHRMSEAPVPSRRLSSLSRPILLTNVLASSRTFSLCSCDQTRVRDKGRASRERMGLEAIMRLRYRQAIGRGTEGVQRKLIVCQDGGVVSHR